MYFAARRYGLFKVEGAGHNLRGAGLRLVAARHWLCLWSSRWRPSSYGGQYDDSVRLARCGGRTCRTRRRTPVRKAGTVSSKAPPAWRSASDPWTTNADEYGSTAPDTPAKTRAAPPQVR